MASCLRRIQPNKTLSPWRVGNMFAGHLKQGGKTGDLSIGWNAISATPTALLDFVHFRCK